MIVKYDDWMNAAEALGRQAHGKQGPTPCDNRGRLKPELEAPLRALFQEAYHATIGVDAQGERLFADIPAEDLVAAWWRGFHQAAEAAIDQQKADREQRREGKRIDRAIRAAAADCQAHKAELNQRAAELKKRVQAVNQRVAEQEEAQALGLRPRDCAGELLFQGRAGQSDAVWRVERFSTEMPHLIRFIKRNAMRNLLDRNAIWCGKEGRFVDDQGYWCPRPPIVHWEVLRAVEAELRRQEAPADAPPPPAPAAPKAQAQPALF